jgi:hypothetical protein
MIILCSTGYVKIAVVLCEWYNAEIHNGPHRMYIGESKIIHNIGTCFAVGYTAGWA